MLIWNIEKELLLTSLSCSIYKRSYQKPSLINFDKNLAVLHSQGVDLWQLETPEIHRKLDITPGFAKMHFLLNGEQLMIQTDKRNFTWLEVDTCRILKTFELPEGTTCFKTLGDGNMIISMRNKNYDSEKAKRVKKRMLTTFRNLDSIPDLGNEFNSIMKSHRSRTRRMMRLKSDLNLVMDKAMLPKSQVKMKKEETVEENITSNIIFSKADQPTVDLDENLNHRRMSHRRESHYFTDSEMFNINEFEFETTEKETNDLSKIREEELHRTETSKDRPIVAKDTVEINGESNTFLSSNFISILDSHHIILFIYKED